MIEFEFGEIGGIHKGGYKDNFSHMGHLVYKMLDFHI